MANVPWIGTGGLPLLGSGGLPLICDETETCACEPGEVTIETCEEFIECFDETVATVTVSGVAEDGCGSCDDLNDVFLVDFLSAVEAVEGECSASHDTDSEDDYACSSSFRITTFIILIESDHSSCEVSVVFEGSSGSFFVVYSLLGTDAYDAINALCSGSPVALDYDSGASGWTGCEWPATITLEVS